MSRISRPSLRGTMLGRTLRIVNPLVRRLLASRLHWPLSRWLILLRWVPVGRRSRRTLPLSYIREGSSVYLTTGERWSSDFARGAPVALRLRGRWYPDAVAETSDEEEAAGTLRRLFAEHAWFRVFSGIPRSASGGANPRALATAIGRGRVLIRVSLTPTRPRKPRAAVGL